MIRCLYSDKCHSDDIACVKIWNWNSLYGCETDSGCLVSPSGASCSPTPLSTRCSPITITFSQTFLKFFHAITYASSSIIPVSQSIGWLVGRVSKLEAGEPVLFPHSINFQLVVNPIPVFNAKKLHRCFCIFLVLLFFFFLGCTQTLVSTTAYVVLVFENSFRVLINLLF